MRHGSEWYKRDPIAYLGGVQGLTTKEHAVYSVVLDLIYQHGGSVNNDPAWISGWIKDMGSAATRNTIQILADKGKLIIDGDQITQKRAKNEAETKENLRGNAIENGRKGGKKSAENRARLNENNTLDEAPASPQNQAEKRREEKKKNNGHPSDDLFTPSFDDFWERWPLKKQKKREAEKSYAKLSKHDRQKATENVRSWARNWRSANQTASDIHPTSYLNGHRWEDDFSSQPQSAAQRPRQSSILDQIRREEARAAGGDQ